MQKNLVNKVFEEFVLPIVPFEVTEKIPDHVRAILTFQIRNLFYLREEYASYELNQACLDDLLNKWWSNHWTMIRSASKRSEWSWDDLALIHDKGIEIPCDFNSAFIDFKILINYCTLDSYPSRTEALKDDFRCPNPTSNAHLRVMFLIPLMVDAFKELIYEENFYRTGNAKNLPYISSETCDKWKAFYNEHAPVNDVTLPNGRTIKMPLFKQIFKEGIAKLPDLIFKNVRTEEELKSLYESNKDLFKAEFYKYLGVLQKTNVNNIDRGPIKTTVLNKMLQFYYRFVTVQVFKKYHTHYVMPENIKESNSLDEVYTWFVNCNYDIMHYPCFDTFRIRDTFERTGYKEVHFGSLNQIWTRLLKYLGGSVFRETLVVSYHPCDMITSAFGYRWSSCQSFINSFEYFPDGYGKAENGTHDYNGCYHGGSFNFLAGNGYIVYVPYKMEYPLWLTAKKNRMLMWTSNALNSMVQNYFYPGKPGDGESLAFARAIREYLQNVYANSNNTKGTIDWKVFSSASTSEFVYRNKYTFVGYNDPILKISCVKETSESRDIIYSERVYLLNGNLEEKIKGRSVICCNKSDLKRITNIIPEQTIECYKNETDKIRLKEYETIKIGDKRYSMLFYLINFDKIKYVDSALLYDIKRYTNKDGVQLVLELPENVEQCKSCGEYFTPDMLNQGYCIRCSVDKLSYKLTDVAKLFKEGQILITYETQNSLKVFLEILHALDDSILWKSGKALTEFLPSLINKVLYLSNNSLVLKSPSSDSLAIYNLDKQGKDGE